MKPILVVIFSVSAIVIGFISIGLQLAALILYSRITNFVEVKYDVVGHGIWCGFLYIATGGQGLFSSYKRPKALRVTVIMSAVSFCGAIVAATLSGLVASGGYTYNCNSFHYASSCQPWLDIEWALMSFSIIAALNHLTLAYYADIAYKNSHNKVRSTIDNAQHSEPPGPYVIYGKNDRPRHEGETTLDSVHASSH